MDWIAWSGRTDCELLRFRLPADDGAAAAPGALLEVNEECLTSLERSSSPARPNHAVSFVGDTGAGKSYLVAQILATPLSRGGELDTRKTEGVRVYSHSPALQEIRHPYRVFLLDTEGLHASHPPSPGGTSVSEEEQERHNSYRRPATRTLIRHLAYQVSDVVVYVWGPDRIPDRTVPAEAAYRACVDCFSSKAMDTGSGRPVDPAVKPALLLLLNKQPVRRCLTLPDAGGASQYVTEDECSAELLGIDAREENCNALSTQFSSVSCFRVPLRGSKWRSRQGGEVTADALLPENILSLEAAIHRALVRQKRAVSQSSPRVFLSQLGWVVSLSHALQRLNAASFNRWAPPSPPSLRLLRLCNHQASFLSSEASARDALKDEYKRTKSKLLSSF